MHPATETARAINKVVVATRAGLGILLCRDDISSPETKNYDTQGYNNVCYFTHNYRSALILI